MSALGLGLGLGLSLGGRRIVGDAGNMPATFSIAAGSVDDGVKRINFSEPVTVTITGDVTVDFGDGQGVLTAGTHTVPDALDYWTLEINGGNGGGTITFGKRKQITYLLLSSLGSSVITGDITGMELTSLYLTSLGSSVITGDITGMELTYLRLAAIGSSIITGDITDMKLTYLWLYNLGSSVIIGDITGMELTYLSLASLGSSVITGDITGMELATLHLQNLGSSLTYGTNLLNITSSNGIQLLGDTVFATAEEYEQLIIDAASGTWNPAGSLPFVITAGTNDNCPDWDTVKADVATLRNKAAWTIIPPAWLTTGGGSWPANWYEYEGE